MVSVWEALEVPLWLASELEAELEPALEPELEVCPQAVRLVASARATNAAKTFFIVMSSFLSKIGNAPKVGRPLWHDYKTAKLNSQHIIKNVDIFKAKNFGLFFVCFRQISWKRKGGRVWRPQNQECFNVFITDTAMSLASMICLRNSGKAALSPERSIS